MYKDRNTYIYTHTHLFHSLLGKDIGLGGVAQLSIGLSQRLADRHFVILHGDGRAVEVLSRIGKVPDKGNCCKASKHDRGVVHSGGVDGDGNRHAEDDDGKDDPHDADAVDNATKFSKREWRILDGATALHEVDQHGNTVRSRQADGGDTSEGVERGRRAEVDASQDAVDNGGQQQSPKRHVPLVVDATPELVAGDGSVTGKGVGATRSGREGSDAGEHEDAQNEEQETEASGGRSGDDLEQSTDGLRIGHLEQHGHVGQDEKDRDQVDDTGDASGKNGQDNGLGDFAFGVLDFFAHGSYHSVTSEGVSGCVREKVKKMLADIASRRAETLNVVVEGDVNVPCRRPTKNDQASGQPLAEAS